MSLLNENLVEIASHFDAYPVAAKFFLMFANGDRLRSAFVQWALKNKFGRSATGDKAIVDVLSKIFVDSDVLLLMEKCVLWSVCHTNMFLEISNQMHRKILFIERDPNESKTIRQYFVSDMESLYNVFLLCFICTCNFLKNDVVLKDGVQDPITIAIFKLVYKKMSGIYPIGYIRVDDDSYSLIRLKIPKILSHDNLLSLVMANFRNSKILTETIREQMENYVKDLFIETYDKLVDTYNNDIEYPTYMYSYGYNILFKNKLLAFIYFSLVEYTEYRFGIDLDRDTNINYRFLQFTIEPNDISLTRIDSENKMLIYQESFYNLFADRMDTCKEVILGTHAEYLESGEISLTPVDPVDKEITTETFDSELLYPYTVGSKNV